MFGVSVKFLFVALLSILSINLRAEVITYSVGGLQGSVELGPSTASDFVYQPPGFEVLIDDVLSASDYLQVTQSIRELPEVSFVFPGRLTTQQVELVIGSSLDRYAVLQQLAQVPGLMLEGDGRYRWRAPVVQPVPEPSTTVIE